MAFQPPQIFLEFESRNREKADHLRKQIGELNSQLDGVVSLHPKECADAIRESIEEYIKPLCEKMKTVEFYYNGNHPSDSELMIDGIFYNRKGCITSGNHPDKNSLPDIVVKVLFNELMHLREDTSAGKFLGDYFYFNFSD